MTHAPDSSFAARQAGIARLVAELERAPDAGASRAAHELVAATLALHAEGLGRLLALLAQAGPTAQAVVEQWMREDVGRGLLLLHGLHPLSLGQRLERGLDAARRVAAEAGCVLEALGSSDTAVSLRIQAGEREVHSERLRADLEAAVLDWAPEIERIQIHGLEGAGLVQLHVSARRSACGPVSQPEAVTLGACTHETP
jgi:hypothetical protein